MLSFKGGIGLYLVDVSKEHYISRCMFIRVDHGREGTASIKYEKRNWRGESTIIFPENQVGCVRFFWEGSWNV